MPKKPKKIKTDKKKKVKGNKDGKRKMAKGNAGDVLSGAIANSQLWESRLKNAITAKNEYRESTRTLLRENEQLQQEVAQTEKDTIEVISFLKNEDIKKDTQMNKLQTLVKDIKKDFKKQKQNLINEYTSEIENLQTSLSEKTNEVKLMQAELKLVKEFRRKRAQMQKELDEIRNNLHLTDKSHQESLEKMERKFFEEKIRLQQEASKKISELAERAHSEAVTNLDETTKSIYMENVRLNEALSYHVKSGDNLTALKKKLMQENKSLNGEKEMNSLIVEEKIIENKQLQEEVRELRMKVTDLENNLTCVISKNESEMKTLEQTQRKEQEYNKMEIARLQRTVELKSKEMCRVRKLAKNILDQRTEMEEFFMDSLDVVKREIVKNRQQYQREAELAYRRRMYDAHSGQAAYPKIRTFKVQQFSTNGIQADFKEAERWDTIESTVNISELTWEQRERVLRLLFAKMNGFKTGTAVASNKVDKLPPIKYAHREAITDRSQKTPDIVPRAKSPSKTFMTETEQVVSKTASATELFSTG